MVVGDQLLTPEEGWVRYDNLDSNISYLGSGWGDDPSHTPYNGSRKYTIATTGHAIRFNFTGSNLRIICALSTNWSNELKISIDGVNEVFSQHGNTVICQILNYQKLNMKNGEHSVEITNVQSGYWGLDAIDIDKDGELKPYNPKSPTEPSKELTLLRVTMLDSSEREYRVSATEVDGFIKWYTRTIGTGVSCYALNDIVDNSQEYLAFEKIISFKVIGL